MNVENLTKLYRVGQRILRERLPIGFGELDCGTFACLAGWYLRETGEEEHVHAYVNFGPSEHFGTTGKQTQKLFRAAHFPHEQANEPGPEAYAELEKRMAYLAGLIREAGGSVPGDGLPDIVRDLFRVEEAA